MCCTFVNFKQKSTNAKILFYCHTWPGKLCLMNVARFMAYQKAFRSPYCQKLSRRRKPAKCPFEDLTLDRLGEGFDADCEKKKQKPETTPSSRVNRFY